MILALIVSHLILSMFMDVLLKQVATISITHPIALAVGVDPIWFGIFIVLMYELVLITPPVGINLAVVHGIRPDKSRHLGRDLRRGAVRGNHDPVRAAAAGDLATGSDVKG